MDTTDGPKQETRRRRRRSGGSVHSVPGSPFETIETADRSGTHTATDTGRGSSAPGRPDSAELTPSEQHHVPLAPVSTVIIDHSLGTTTRSQADFAFNPRISSGRHTGKRRASGELIHEETKTMQFEVRRPNISEPAVVSTTTLSETSGEQDAQGHELNVPAVAATHTPALRVSTRRTTTTTRWSPSMTGAREHPSRAGARRSSRAAGPQRPQASSGSVVTPPARPISNATRNITFAMLQPHFERPLQRAADSFGVCTTLLKKICRRNGISNWPYRKICGLRKSISSMEKQVNYFDGEQKRAYADQLEKLECELQAYLRTGNEPTQEFLHTLTAKAATEQQMDQSETQLGNEDEEKEPQPVPAWTARPSIAPPQYSDIHESQPTGHLLANEVSTNAWSNVPFLSRQAPSFPTIATHHHALPSIASILQHQSYSSPSRAASTQNPPQYEVDQQSQWRYFSPTNDDAV